MKTNIALGKSGSILGLMLAFLGSPDCLTAVEVAMSLRVTRDGSTEFVDQEWIGLNLAKRWTYKYSTSGAAPGLTFDYQYKEERSVRDEDTDTWGGWSVAESGSATATPVPGPPTPIFPIQPPWSSYASPQSVSHYFTDYDGTTTANSYEMNEGHCPGLTLFSREKADYGDKIAPPFWFIAYTASVSDNYLFTAPGGWYVTPSAPLGMAWKYKWPTDADLQIRSTDSHGWTDYVTWSPEIYYSDWYVPVQGVVWLFDLPSFTSVTLNQAASHQGSADSMT